MDRKRFLSRSFQALAGSVIAGPALLDAACTPGDGPASGNKVAALGTEGLVVEQLALPYAFTALEPAIDARTMEIHYTRHHAGYVKNINEAILAEAIPSANMEALLATVGNYSAKARNNAGGAWNHDLFWQVMGPGGTGVPTGKVADALNAAFGSIDAFKAAFTDAAMKRFGSGWAWLTVQQGKLAIGSTPNQDNPLMDVSEFQGIPLLALDVWEHAYYLKYQNKRNEYVANWWGVVNWDEVARRLG